MPNATALLDDPILVEDNLPSIGQILPFFQLVNAALEDVSLDAFSGQRKILHFFPGIDTPTSANSVRILDSMVATLTNTVVLHISADLPFTTARFCATENLSTGIHLSTLRGRDMLKNYGVLMMTSKLAGLPARVLMVADEDNRVLHVELVKELANEPDYEAAMAVLQA
ncbi:thiol peroxidase [Methylophilus sp. TWE2]|uniref:thiol peroxidase n=1 Tax=Methylophilus sp. TWE2 TaxID=1662285 RepID=UPI00067120AB|nr:thiol peroxidase [Methylophilus sp. TWE2]AKR44633.1 peroxidase [Methylophilus sp. TWE2]